MARYIYENVCSTHVNSLDLLTSLKMTRREWRHMRRDPWVFKYSCRKVDRDLFSWNVFSFFFVGCRSRRATRLSRIYIASTPSHLHGMCWIWFRKAWLCFQERERVRSTYSRTGTHFDSIRCDPGCFQVSGFRRRFHIRRSTNIFRSRSKPTWATRLFYSLETSGVATAIRVKLRHLFRAAEKRVYIGCGCDFFCGYRTLVFWNMESSTS